VLREMAIGTSPDIVKARMARIPHNYSFDGRQVLIGLIPIMLQPSPKFRKWKQIQVQCNNSPASAYNTQFRPITLK
jgi:hypothetical protein